MSNGGEERVEWGAMGVAYDFSSVDGLAAHGASPFHRVARWVGQGEPCGVAFVTLASANFGTARENFSLGFSRKTRTALDTANRLEL